MSFEYFISKKTLKSVVQGKKVSKPIVRISIISIALAIIVNLITIAVVSGFQQEVRQKVSGFGSHMFVMNASEHSIYEAEAIKKNDELRNLIQKQGGIQSISPVAYKAVLFQSEKNTFTYKLASGKDTSELIQDIQGAILKGVDSTYDLSFFTKHLVNGKLPNLDSESEEILISEKVATDLSISVSDTIDAFFVRTLPVKRKFIVSGIYNSGLQEFDKKIAIGPISKVQELNDWGIQVGIYVEDTLFNDHIIIHAEADGGNRNYRYDWGEGFVQYSRIPLQINTDTLIRVVASDYWSNIRSSFDDTSIPDTAYLKVSVKSSLTESSSHANVLTKTYDETGFSVFHNNKEYHFEQLPGKGSYGYYIGGYEVTVADWEKLEETTENLRDKIEFKPTVYGELLKIESIKDTEEDIFVWLDFLDINVIIILVLMILIGIINMGSALLVLILVRTNFIGIMKAMGASNWSIRKIFLIQAGFLIGKGMLWGNIIGLGLCFLQWQFGLFQLNPEVYYLSEVPIQLSILNWVILNIATLAICILALVVPSVVITKISPVKSIKFN